MLKHSVLLTSLLLLASAVTGQSGILSGTVTGADDGSPLPGASVYLASNPALGTVTDLDGAYRLVDLPVGTDTLVVSYVGFATESIPVDVVAGEVLTVDASLGGSAVMGQEVIVTAQLLGQAKAINQQLNSDAIANFVSADKIKELPDVNAAEAISRLPGVAINRNGGEGSKVVVRGLDPKFTAININGTRLPSTSGTDRSVDLSLISPELLSGIELFKSPTPDMDGDALGGTINLNILRADDRPRASLKAIGGYNDLAGQFRDYKFTGSFNRRIFDGRLGVIGTANVERFNRGSYAVGQGWGDKRDAILDDSLDIFDQQAESLTLRRDQEIRRRYNGSLGFDYAFGESTDLTLLGIFSRTTRDEFNHREGYDIENTSSNFRPNIRESSISLYSGSLTMRHKLPFMRVEWGVSYSETAGETPLNIGFDVRTEGDNFRTGVLDDRNDPTRIYNFININPSRTYLYGANYSDSGNEEQIGTAFADFTFPFGIGKKIRADFKVGGKIRRNSKSRYYEEYYDKLFYLRNNSTWNALNDNPEGATGLDPSGNTYLGISNFLDSGSTLSVEDNTGTTRDIIYPFDEAILRRFDDLFSESYPQDFFGITNNFDLEENILAGYAMFKFKVGEWLTVIPGARYERNDNTYNGIYADLNGDWGQFGARDPRTATAQYGRFLPHLHVKYQPLDWFDIRASYSTTLARPDFNYIVPATLVNRNGDITVDRGNPELQPSVSRNLDLFFTAFEGSLGLVSVGGFYKQIEDAFYPVTLGVNDSTIALANGLPATGFNGAELTSYSSSPESEVYGVEFDVQSRLSFLPKPLDGLIFNINYALLYSNTTISSFGQDRECIVVGGRPRCTVNTFTYERETNLIGQAESILNTSLGYDIGGFSARVSAAYQGSKITGYSASADKDSYDAGFWRMDAAVKYRFSRRLNVFLNLNNLTNQQDVTYFRRPRFETNRATYGTTATVGVEVSFLPKETY